MARRANLSFGSLNPFGGGDQSFSSFSVGKGSVSASNEAYLQFQKVETDYQAGRVDDATYQAAFETYRGSLTANTTEAVNAQARAESLAYSISRDTLTQQVQSGQQSWSALVQFDQSSLAGLNPGSQEYRDRESRLWSSQVNEFRDAEQRVSDDLAAERITYTQALDWYEGAKGMYGGNFELLSAIDNTIKKVKAEVIREADDGILNAWKGGTLGLDQLLGYAAKVQAEDPNSPRARTWADNARVATNQAVETSLSYRYGLTEEYRDLELLVASAKAPTGNTSISKSIQYVYTANGWVAKTVVKSKTSPPTAAEQQAYKELLVKVGVAKKRMGEITKLVGTMPGGWVSEDDIIARLADSQATMVKGSPAWFDIQSKIDSYNERKRADEIMRLSGVVVNLPTVKSERTASSDVGATEKPFAPTPGGVKLPAAPKAATGGGGGGSGGGTALTGGKGGLPGPKNTTAPGNTLFQILGPANSKSKLVSVVQTVGGPVSVAYKRTGLPVGLSEADFKALYTGMTKAVRDGETTWTNPTTGVGYVLPPDPSDRLAIMSTLDKQNIAQRLLELNTNPTQTNLNNYNASVRKANDNTLHVMDQPKAGIPTKIPNFVDSLIAPYLAEDRNAAPIAAAIDYMTRVEDQGKVLGDKAKGAMKEGNVEQAYQYLTAFNAVIGGSNGPVAKATYWASIAETAVEDLVAGGATIDKTGQLGTDIEKMRSLGSASAPWLGKVMNQSGLEEIASFFANAKDDPQFPYALNPATGQPIVDARGAFKMNEGWQRELVNGVIKPVQLTPEPGDDNKMTSYDPTKMIVQLQVGDGFRDVQVPFTIGRVGTAVMADGTKAPIDGKRIDVVYNGRRYLMAQDPMNPSRWVPFTQGLSWQLPAGAMVVNGSAQLGKTGNQIVFSITADSGSYGTGYGGSTSHWVLAPDTDGTYVLSTVDANGAFTGDRIRVGDERGQRILADSGIKLDTSVMTWDQKSYLNSGLNGIYLGDPNRVLLEAAQMRNVAYGPGGGAGGSGFLVNSFASWLPKPSKPKPPVSITVATPTGGSRTVVTGQVPTPVGQPASYEGVGGTNIAPAPYIAPLSAAIASATQSLIPQGSTPVLAPTTGFTIGMAPKTPTPSLAGKVVAPGVVTTATGAKKLAPTPVIKPPPAATTGSTTTANKTTYTKI
jgi:hypothetical protein